MPSVQELEAAIRACAAERQALHERDAAADELERNRLEIVSLQWQLSRAWIERRRSETDRAA
jgi:hypothetical protein